MLHALYVLDTAHRAFFIIIRQLTDRLNDGQTESDSATATARGNMGFEIKLNKIK